MIKVLKMPCNCTPPTKPAYKSKTNWLVNLPLFSMAALSSFQDIIPPVMVLWAVAILNFYLRNFDQPMGLTFKKQQEDPLTNQKTGVILPYDVQSSNQGDIKKSYPGGTNG